MLRARGAAPDPAGGKSFMFCKVNFLRGVDFEEDAFGSVGEVNLGVDCRAVAGDELSARGRKKDDLNHYKLTKRLSISELGVPTQCVLHKTLTNPKGVTSIMSKILTQVQQTQQRRRLGLAPRPTVNLFIFLCVRPSFLTRKIK